MSQKINRKYIDSHWLFFAIQGAITLFFGWYTLFSGSTDATYLASIVGLMLLGLGVVELCNLLLRQRLRETWGFTMFAAAFEVIAGLALLFTLQQNPIWALAIMALYTLIRGICELLIAFKAIDDSTDRFIWLICGICGVVISFVIFNSGNLPEGMFAKIFASYLVILGVANLIYGAHNREQKRDDALARRASAKKGAKTRAKNKSTKGKSGKRAKK